MCPPERAGFPPVDARSGNSRYPSIPVVTPQGGTGQLPSFLSQDFSRQKKKTRLYDILNCLSESAYLGDLSTYKIRQKSLQTPFPTR